MTSITSSLFAKNFGRYSKVAQREPVHVTAHGQENVVVMGFHEYQRLRSLDRRVYSSADLPDDLRQAIAVAKAPDEAKKFDSEVIR